MVNQPFQAGSFAEWKAAAEASLKGASLSKLYSTTAEGIRLKPLYTKKDRPATSSLPGEKPFTRGFHRVWRFPDTEASIGMDPISAGAAAGVFPAEAVLRKVWEQETVVINIAPYHLAGANAVQEIALALSEAACFLKAAEKKDTTASNWLIHFAVGTVFFTEIAKIRAFRTLWSSFMEVFHLKDQPKPVLSVETSEAMLSFLDPHMNLLRTGSAAFAAVIGNVDHITAVPFDKGADGRSSELGQRMARNIPQILKHEALLDKVLDPAGGSYFIESLTEDIGRRAWDLFADMEEAGGIKQALEAGTVQNALADARKRTEQNMAVRRQKMVGVNVYANGNEQIESQKNVRTEVMMDGSPIPPLGQKRTAESYEALRLKAATYRQTGQSLTAGLLCLGEEKAFSQRADYAADVLAIAGIETVRSGECRTLKEAIQFIKTHPTVYYCICGSDETYKQFSPSLAAELKKSANGAVIDIAGSWNMKGVDGRIASGDDFVQKLTNVLSLFKGGGAL